jgi:hypothetical protein
MEKPWQPSLGLWGVDFLAMKLPNEIRNSLDAVVRQSRQAVRLETCGGRH